MAGEILLETDASQGPPKEGRWLDLLEKKISHLLASYEAAVRERDELAQSLLRERERAEQLEKKLQLLCQDREKVKGRIDQLLQRLNGFDR